MAEEAVSFGKFVRVYLGLRVENGKRYYAWTELPDLQAHGVDAPWYRHEKQKVAGAVVGGRYEHTWADAEHTQYYVAGPLAPVYLGLYEDQKLVAALHLKHRAASAVLAVKAQEKKAGRLDVIREALAPLRRVYVLATPTERTAIEVLVLQVLRREV